MVIINFVVKLSINLVLNAICGPTAETTSSPGECSNVFNTTVGMNTKVMHKLGMHTLVYSLDKKIIYVAAV